jgi:hypothetical protein
MEKEIKYNHDRSLVEFEEDLKIIREHGYNPIAVTQMMLEDTFVFETEEESLRAYNELEVPKKCHIVGWWYGKEDFLKAVEEYELEANKNRVDNKVLKMKIYWL